MKTRPIALAIALLAVLSAPAVLLAHARLTRSMPAADARLDHPPDAVMLWFSEHPELRFTAVHLLDSSGATIPLGAAARITGDASGVTLPVTSPLVPGRYTVVWRTAGADGHASAGRFAFVVAPPTAPLVAAALPDTHAKANALTGAPKSAESFDGVGAAERWAQIIAILTVIGAIAFRSGILPNAELPAAVATDALDRARRLAQAALVLALLASITRLAAATALVPGSEGGRAWLAVIRETRWGQGWCLGAGGILIAGIGLTVARSAPAGWMIAGIGAVAMALSEPLTGHATAATSYWGLSVGSDFVHLAAAGAWVGGLFVVLLAGLPALNVTSSVEQAVLGRRLVLGYHRVAVVSVAIVALTGIVNGWLRLGALSALWTSDYGRVLLIKLVFVVILLFFGLYHWRRVVTAPWEPGVGARFKLSAAGEIVAGAIVLAATAVLLSSSLPTT